MTIKQHTTRKILTVAGLVALVATAAAIGTASATQAAAKPGFMPGTWNGKGTIKGDVVDGPLATHFSGGIAFTLKVNKKLGVAGGGTWQMNMLGSQDAPSSYGVDSTMQGTASIRLAGTSTSVTFSGLQKIVGEIRSAGVSVPLKPREAKLVGRLTITRAGKCKVVGSSRIQPGVTLSWSAKLKGSGTCNA